MLYSHRQRVYLAIFLVVVLLFINIDFAEAHLIGSGVITKRVENYEVRFQILPLSLSAEQPATLGFSILDEQGSNVWNLEASVKVQKDGDTIFTSPKARYEISDFYIEYIFPEEGRYQVMLDADIADEPKTVRADFGVIVGEDTGSSGLSLISMGMIGAGVVALISLGIIGVVSLFLKRRAKGTKG
ncbi:MAG: hypothetical protein ACE5J2_00430 [Nitrososphaerales archaeon]